MDGCGFGLLCGIISVKAEKSPAPLCVLRNERQAALMKIVVLDGYLVNFDRQPWILKERFPDLIWYDATPPEETVDRIGDAEAVFTNRVTLDREVLRQAANLRYIGFFGTGYNYVDLKAARERGITVTNVPGYSSYAVAQNTAALLLAAANRVAEFSAFVKGGGWRSPADPEVTAVPLMELYGKTVGIYGCGDIGTAFGRICLAFGMRVLGWRRSVPPSTVRDGILFTDEETLLKESDVLSLHCPLTEETRGLVDEAFLSRMKDGAILLNTARGGLLDEGAVSRALDRGKLSMAGVDVLSSEPPAPDNPLVRNSRCIITPHVSWSPKETRARLLRIAAENFLAFLEGHPQNTVG